MLGIHNTRVFSILAEFICNRRDTLASNECHHERCLIKHSMVFIVTIRALINRDEDT